MMETPKYKRVLLKISGEALAGDSHSGLDFPTLHRVAEAIGECVHAGAQVGLVVGGGNFWRGVKNGEGKIERTRADYMGMLATAMNALAVCDVLEQHGIPAVVQTALDITKISEAYNRVNAVRHLEEGKVVIFACGSGCPFFSTDTAAALRAAEIEADIIFKASMVDGIYDSDPHKNPNAKKFDHLTYMDVLNKDLKVMDSTAATLCKDNGISLLVFNLEDPENIVRAVRGENIGTLVD